MRSKPSLPLFVSLVVFSSSISWGETPPAKPLATAQSAAPIDFSAPNQDGTVITLSKLRGHPVLLYFYPADDTPGCTREACQFRDQFSQFKKLDAIVFGISVQDPESHKKFIKKHKLPFDLLVDRGGKIAELLGVDKVPILKIHRRESILFDKTGRVFRHYKSVDPDQHAHEVLQDIKKLP